MFCVHSRLLQRTCFASASTLISHPVETLPPESSDSSFVIPTELMNTSPALALPQDVLVGLLAIEEETRDDCTSGLSGSSFELHASIDAARNKPDSASSECDSEPAQRFVIQLGSNC